MGSDAEPAKILLPYLQRADELQKHEPLVAYYCRLYAMERGLKIPVTERTKTTKDLLISLMSQLEKDKKSLQLGPEDNLHVEGFALSVFAKADKQDRAGRADLNTAKTFYAARIFFEILKQFGELQPDIEKMQKYAIWKAADIRKALSEGRKPQPGPPGGDDDLITASEAPLDKGVTEKAGFQASDVQPAAEQFSNASQMPGSGASVSSSMPTEHQHGYSDSEVSSYQPVHHSDVSASGYPSSYSDSHLAQMPDASGLSRSPSLYQYGSVTASDGSDSQPFHYAYTAMPHNGQMGSHPMLSPYNVSPVMGNAPLDASYYQNVQYTGSAPFAADTTSLSQYSSHPPDGRAVGYNDSVPIERTTSAPASDVSAGIPVKAINNSSYQPPPEKIAEAHKVSRFAVSALAFDDVPTAISYLKRSLELLTNPSAPVH